MEEEAAARLVLSIAWIITDRALALRSDATKIDLVCQNCQKKRFFFMFVFTDYLLYFYCFFKVFTAFLNCFLINCLTLLFFQLFFNCFLKFFFSGFFSGMHNLKINNQV